MTEAQTMPEVQNEPGIIASNAINEYFKTAAPSMVGTQKVRITAAVMELLRMTSDAAVAAKDNPQVARIALIELIGQLCGVDWEKISFSITKAAIGAKQPTQAVYEALITFANVAQIQPEAATEGTFTALLSVQEPSARPTEPPKPAKQAPAVASNTAVERVFKPAKFVPGGTPLMELLSWQSEIPGHGLGPVFEAVLLDGDGPETKILLETGEVTWIPQASFLLAKASDPQEYDHVSPHLLANFRAYADWQWLAYPPLDETFDARIGKFAQPLVHCLYSPDAVNPIREVFEHPERCPAGNAVSVTLTVDGTPYSVTLTAQVSKTGPYVTAKLLDADENVVMRLDQPRMFSVRGVYLFPLSNQVIAFTVK
jgi:hypothetical protein